MGSHNIKPTTIKFDVPEAAQDLYEKFSIIRIVNGQRKADAFTDLVKAEVSKPENIELLKTNWLRWDDFELAMIKHGFLVNRVTMWKYKNKEPYCDLIKGDGVDILLNLDGFLEFYKRQGAVK